jgi:hypothetical protein
MAKGNYNKYIKNQEGILVNTKKYLYVLRPILACVWINKFNTIPPMRFDQIYNDKTIQEYVGPKVFTNITDLIFSKVHGLELDQQERIPILDEFIEKQIPKYEDLAKRIDFEINNNYIQLDHTFKQFAKGLL